MSSYIHRTWQCHNTACARVFNSHQRNPACPKCGCIRVGWVPGRVNIGSETTRHNDTTLRDLAQAYGLSDLRSAREGESVKVPARASGGSGVMNFQGFAANIDPSAGPQCVPTVNRINAKVSSGIGQKLPGGKLGLPSIGKV